MVALYRLFGLGNPRAGRRGSHSAVVTCA